MLAEQRRQKAVGRRSVKSEVIILKDFEWPFVTKYIKVTTNDLNSPEELEFCKMLEEWINKAFDVLMREKLRDLPNDEKDTA